MRQEFYFSTKSILYYLLNPYVCSHGNHLYFTAPCDLYSLLFKERWQPFVLLKQ